MNHFIDKFILGNEHKWFWFISTAFFGASPMLVTALITLNTPNPSFGKLYKVVDLIALGLTMCVSNLNLVGSKKFDLKKGVLVALSFCFLFLFAICYGITQVMPGTYWFFDAVLHLFVAGSIFLSYASNKYVFDAVKKP